jgi:hypothetical protein
MEIHCFILLIILLIVDADLNCLTSLLILRSIGTKSLRGLPLRFRFLFNASDFQAEIYL